MKKTHVIKKNLFVVLGFTCLAFSTNISAETLQNALNQTLQTNPDILSTQKDRFAIAEELRQAKAGYLPTLDATAGYGTEHTENAFTQTGLGTTQSLHRKETGLSANQMLFDGFATHSEVNRNKARVCSAGYKILGTSQDVLLNATKAYLTVLEEQQLVRQAQANVATHQNIDTLIGKRNEKGLDQSADLTQAQGRLDLAQANLKAEQANLADSQSIFLQIVGTMPSNLSMPGPISPEFMPASEEQAVQMAVQNHPILKSAQQDMLAAYAQHKAAQSPYYPRFDLQLRAEHDNDVDGIEGKNNNEQAMVRMNYNLYHGGADKARQDQTAYLYQASAEVMHKTYRQVVNNAQLAWIDWQTAKLRLPLLAQHAAAANKTFVSYQKQFQLDKRTLLDTLDSEDESNQARRAYIQGQFDVNFGKYKVLNSIGNLMQAEHVGFSNADNN